ncbi:MAG: hypothetical protein J6B85_13010 [Lachnospiraceae bacterium]|nr:hypothetical protein [Lachnospiraceae bacterium]
MKYAYLGFVETLQDIFKALFDTILTPVLNDVLFVVFNQFLDTVKELVSELLLQLLIILWKAVDFLEAIFDIFSGYRYVYQRSAADPNRLEPVYLLDYLFDLDPIKKAFVVITLLAAGLAMMFTIFAVAKSISDMALGDRNPVGKVLSRALKTGVNFIMIPLLALFLLNLSSIVVVKVSNIIIDAYGVTDADSPPTIGTVIFLTGSMEAGYEQMEKKEELNDYVKSKSYVEADDSTYLQLYKEYQESLKKVSFNTSPRKEYFTMEKKYYDKKSDGELELKDYFDPKGFDMIICLVCTVLVIFIMASDIFLFVRRIFELLILYLVSPLFACTMPFDDGAAFSKWRNLFIAKFFSGFGSVFGMKLYLVLVPIIVGGDITLNANPTVDYLIKLFVVIGGAWATYKSQHLILQILNPEAAAAAQESTAMMVGAVMTVGSAIATRGSSLIGNVTGSKGKAAKGSSGSSSGGGSDKESGGSSKGSSGDGQAFRG